MSQRTKRSLALSIVAAVIEGYDATVFAVYAVVIGAKFFATGSGPSSLLLAMSAFAAGYVTRPLGALLLGALADKLGRKLSVTLIVIVMCTATGMIGLLPTFETIGVAASVIVVLTRMLHGLAAGGATGTGTLYIAELVPERNRGLFVSAKQSASVGSFLIAILCGTVILTASEAQASNWAWRIPFLLALPFGLLGLWLQRFGEETADYEAKREQMRNSNPIMFALKSYKYRVFLGTWSGILHNSSALVIFLFMPAYAMSQLELTIADVTIAGIVSALLTIAANTYGGHIADRIGFKQAMLISAALTLLVIYPCFMFLTTTPSLGTLLLAQATLGVVSAPFCSVNLAFKAQLFPPEVRGTCLSVNNSLSTLLFVGMSSVLVTWMLDKGILLAPAHYLSVTTALSILGLFFVRQDMLYTIRSKSG
ncbi:MAG: MFS transporter [Xanthomonadales bacterium]|nr:MFS transporter [Xanthomonadales bacterium]